MRRILALMLVLLTHAVSLSAQELVIDPSQIAASAINAGDQIDYMLDQLGELTSLTDKLAGVKQYVEDVFGEDGIGGKVIGVMEDLGTLKRLTETYNSTIGSIRTYSEYMKESGSYGLSDANTLLMYLNSCRDMAEEAVTVAKNVLTTVGFTKKEKKDEIDRITMELDEKLKAMQKIMDIEIETSIEAEAFCQLIDYLDDNLDSKGYVESLKGYGTAEGAGSGTVGVISLLLGLMGAAFVGWGYLHYVRGSMTGDSSADLAFLRIGMAMLAGTVILQIISQTFGFHSI